MAESLVAGERSAGTLRRFFRTPKGLTLLTLIVLVVPAAVGSGVSLVAPLVVGSVGAAMAVDFAILRVRDLGIGIAHADQERLFQRLERAVSSRHFGGLGLGLYLSRRIVEAHGGTIRLESAGLGHGATFVVELPFLPPHALVSQPRAEGNDAGRARGSSAAGSA